MSTAVFPTLIGRGWDVNRTADWSGNSVVASVSGKRTAVANWTYPRWSWELTYNMLRSDAVNAELQTLSGFYNARQGMFDTFLYQDLDDNAVTGQALGEGDATTTAFQLIRSWGGFLEPVFAPHAVSAVYLNGVVQASGWSVSHWGTSAPGVLTFTSAPGAGVVITADFSFYFPCRFDTNSVQFNNFLSGYYGCKSIKLSSEK